MHGSHGSYTTPDYPGKGGSSREQYEKNPFVAWIYAVVASIVAGAVLVALILIWGTGDLLWLWLILAVVFVIAVAIVITVLIGWWRATKHRRSSRGTRR